MTPSVRASPSPGVTLTSRPLGAASLDQDVEFVVSFLKQFSQGIV